MNSQPGNLDKLHFDASKPDAFDAVRQLLLHRIRNEPSFDQFSPNIHGGGFSHFVTFAGLRDRDAFPRFLLDAFWSLVVEGVIAPGNEKGDPNPSLFHVTEHGKRVFAEPDYQPHDSTEYLRQLGVKIPGSDATVRGVPFDRLPHQRHGVLSGAG